MSPTGTATALGTAEEASLSRAAYSLHLDDPVLDDRWAVELHTPERQALARDPRHFRRALAPGVSPMAPIAAIGIGTLRYADDVVEHCVRALGFRQYVVLGAGFDTFALRRGDLAPGLRVFEVDHPAVQAVKRERIEAAARRPAALPELVPVDFERTRLAPALRASGFDADAPAVLSWLNTLPYLTEDAIEATLLELRDLAAPGSRLLLNHATTAAPSAEQRERLTMLRDDVARRGEPFHSRFDDAACEALLARGGFAIVERLTERELTGRYFADRADGWAPGLPLRLIHAERRS